MSAGGQLITDTPDQASTQERSNAHMWATGDQLDSYANRILTPVEVLIFARYREALSGRALDLGCGAGRVLSYLIMFGAQAYGIDLAPKMVDYCTRTFPDAVVRVGDVSALGECVDGLFDIVLAPDNLIDVFGEFHGIDRELDIHVALHLAATAGVDEFLGRFGDDGIAVVIKPIDQRTD